MMTPSDASIVLDLKEDQKVQVSYGIFEYNRMCPEKPPVPDSE